MKIYIIRHGETELNKQGLMQGITDAPLNASGREIAEISGRNMRGIRFDACVSSPLCRARETAEIILRESGNGDVPVAFDERIKEINGGIMEGKKLTDGPMDPEQAVLFHKDPPRFPGFPGGEDIPQLMKRTQDFLRELARKDDGRTWLVSTHGTALRAMLNFLYPDPSSFWQGHSPYNCAVSILEAQGGELRLVEMDRIFYDASLAVDRYEI